jgi:hypothetical protein
MAAVSQPGAPPGAPAEPAHDATSARALRVIGVVFLAIWLVAAAPWRGLAGPATWALLLGALAAVLVRGPAAALPRWLLAPSARAFTLFAVLASFGASLWFVRTVCPAQPISIDASVYLFEARALSHGHFGMPLPSPRQAFGGRFLFEGPDHALYGVFPPGYPLFLAPFVALGAQMLAGPVVAALLTHAQARLGRALLRDELAVRVSLLLGLPSFARAVETADLLSHAFAGALAAYAFAFVVEALRAPAESSSRARTLRAVGCGAAAAWAITARLLDGVLIAAVLLLPLGWGLLRKRLSPRWIVIAALATLPFAGVLFAQQRAATGVALRPTQSEYFARADWPPTCHRIGFGRDVGCANEHPDARAAHGDDGYGLDDAAHVIRERAQQIGTDLIGSGLVLTLCFLPLLLRPRPAEALLAAFVVALTIGYGLFYYGNAPIHGARHLFPIAPFAWLLLGRVIADPPHRRGATEGARFGLFHARGVALSAIVASATVGGLAVFGAKYPGLRAFQGHRSPPRAVVEAERIDRGIVRSKDNLSIYAATDLFTDPPDLLLVSDDRAGQLELRRAHPDLPMFLMLDDRGVGRFGVIPAPPGFTLEIEAAYPSFMRPEGLAGRWFNMPASGGNVMVLFESRPGAVMRIPFDVARAGRYALKITGGVAPSYGRWDLALDGVVFATWEGWAEIPAMRTSPPSAPRDVAQGAHLLELRCVGRAPASTGHDGLFDVLVGVPAP